ncbi:MAG TPA: type II secretion system protein GspL [Steroidobacteraceae bacterium]|nr:type II secretion system protein GspL [Steroidobacteraceae bacterium]
MSESLVIHLRDGAAPQWLVCNDDGQVIVNPVSGELAQATAMAAGRRVAVIVPAGDALATDSDAPAKSAAKLAQVVPFALEERVADEIEDLHFAIGERAEAGARVPVVVVARTRVQGWLNDLQAAGLVPTAIYSAATLLPSMPGQMIALLDGDSLTLRLGDAQPLVLPALSITDGIEMVLATQQSAVAGLEPAPLGLLLYTGQDEWDAHQHEIDALRDRFTGVKVQLLPSGPITVLAPAAAADDAVNVLQGAFAISNPVDLRWKSWRLAAMLAGALVLLHIGARYFELNRLEKSETVLDSSIEDAFRAAMPGQNNATNARRRVELRLAEVRSGGGGALLPALGALATARNAAPKANIEGITFRDGIVQLRISAPDAASLDAIGQQLRSSNWQADILGGTASGDSYRGSMQIKKAGA